LVKSTVSITVDREVLKWIRCKVEERVFASRSHAFEYAVTQLMKNEKPSKSPQNSKNLKIIRNYHKGVFE